MLTSNKRALSEIVAYVLLISIAIALSILVYNWLRFYVQPGSELKCPEDTGMVINDYSCIISINSIDFNVIIQNKGYFNVSGFLVRVNDRDNATIGYYTLGDAENIHGIALGPGDDYEKSYSFNKQLSDSKGQLQPVTKITLLEVQPFIGAGENLLFCNSVTQKVECELVASVIPS